jgi:hypothetical protein
MFMSLRCPDLFRKANGFEEALPVSLLAFFDDAFSSLIEDGQQQLRADDVPLGEGQCAYRQQGNDGITLRLRSDVQALD